MAALHRRVAPPSAGPGPDLLARFRANGDAAFAFAVFGMIAVMLVPIPAWALDMMLAGSITASLLVFLVALYTARPVEFSVFPSVLLITTLFRLSLNVASTRLILLHGAEGPGAAGHVIHAVGEFLIGGNYVVGFILFSILVVINFIVITKGAGRVAEVAARFTLDAMPGKQMAIDAELNAGLIDEKVARRRRAELARESDFFAAMDGASKFIKGDAIAAILIMLINVVAGVLIGVVMNGLDLRTAMANYTVLTIGDGLASQFPSLICSAAAGMLVTRVNDIEVTSLDAQVGRQMFGNPRVLAMLATLACVFMLIPGLRLVFAVVAAGAGLVAWRLRDGIPVTAVPVDEPTEAEQAAGPPEPKIEDLLRVDPIAVELAMDLLYLGDEARGGQLVDRVHRIRRHLAQQLGVVIPTVRLRDNGRLQTGQYRVLLRGEIIGSGTVVARQALALDPGTATGTLKGTPGVDPVFGLKGFWVADSQRLRAQGQGYTVVDVPTVLTTHLEDLLKRYAHELYGRQQLGEALERVSQENPKLVEELVPDPLPRAALLRVFRNLVAEGVGVKNVQGILEALAEYAPRTRDPDVLTEFVRQRMARTITARVVSDDGTLRYVSLAHDLEDAVARGLQGAEGGAMSLLLDPDTTRKLIAGVRQQIESYPGPGDAVLLVPPLARSPMRRLLEKALPRVSVVSPGEIVPGTPIACVGEITLDAPARKASRG